MLETLEKLIVLSRHFLITCFKRNNLNTFSILLNIIIILLQVPPRSNSESRLGFISLTSLYF